MPFNPFFHPSPDEPHQQQFSFVTPILGITAIEHAAPNYRGERIRVGGYASRKATLFFRKEQFRIRFDSKPCKIFFISICISNIKIWILPNCSGKNSKTWIIERFQPERSYDDFEFDIIFKSFPMFVFPILRRIWILTFLREILNLSIIQFREIKHFQIAIFEACKIFPESPYLFPNLHFVRWTRCSSINIESDERCEIKREYISTRELSASLGSLHRSRPVPYDLSFSFSPSSLSTPCPTPCLFPRFSVSLGETRFAEGWNMLTFTGDRGPSTREWESREWRTRRD